jgi:hypothetical protein
MELAIAAGIAAVAASGFVLGYTVRRLQDHTRDNALWDLRHRYAGKVEELQACRLALYTHEHQEPPLPPYKIEGREGLVQFPSIWQEREGPHDPYKGLRKRSLWAMRPRNNQGQDGA